MKMYSQFQDMSPDKSVVFQCLEYHHDKLYCLLENLTVAIYIAGFLPLLTLAASPKIVLLVWTFLKFEIVGCLRCTVTVQRQQLDV